MSASQVGVTKHAIDGTRRPIPLLDLGAELFAAFGCDVVVPGTAVVLAGAPLGADPSARDRRLEGRVLRPLVDIEDVSRDLAQPEGDAPAVHGLVAEEREREHLERAPHDFGAGPGAVGRHVPLDSQKEKIVWIVRWRSPPAFGRAVGRFALK